MKNIYAILVLLVLLTIGCEDSITDENLYKSVQKKGNSKQKCATIQSETIYYPTGHYLGARAISTGFDIFGYNYQAHIFNGYYANLYLGEEGYPPYTGNNETYLDENPDLKNDNYFLTYYWPYRNDDVNMTWNDTWLSNKDCNNDGSLDVEQNTIGSGAWQNYHSKGIYDDENGNKCNWVLQYKIIAVPEYAYLENGFWYDVDDNEIGENFYNEWAIIQIISNDPCGGENGVKYKSPFRVGFGNR